jgi:hypothetical protein
MEYVDTSDTTMTVSFTFEGVPRTMEIKGESAENGPHLLMKFVEFLEGVGFDFSELKPPLTYQKVAKAAATMLVLTFVQFATPPFFVVGDGNKKREAPVVLIMKEAAIG